MAPYFEQTESPSTERSMHLAGSNLSHQKIRQSIQNILLQDPEIPANTVDKLTDKLYDLTETYEDHIFQRIFDHDYDPDSQAHNEIIVELLVTGQYDGTDLYAPILSALGRLTPERRTYQALFLIVNTMLLNRLCFVRRVEYATRCFPLFSALKRLLLKQRRNGETYYSAICTKSGKDVSERVQEASGCGYYHFGNDEAVDLLSGILIQEIGDQPVNARNMLQKWRSGKPISCENKTVFKFAYAFALPLYSDQSGAYSAEYLFENAENSVWDVMDAEQDLMRYGLFADMSFHDAYDLICQYRAYCAENGVCPAVNRSTAKEKLEYFFTHSVPDQIAFFSLMASLGIQPDASKNELENLLTTHRTQIAQRYMQEIFSMLSQYDTTELRKMVRDLCEQALDTLQRLRQYGYLDEAAGVVRQYFTVREAPDLLNGNELFRYYSEIYDPDRQIMLFKEKDEDVGYCEENADRPETDRIAAMLDFLCDNATDNGKTRLLEQKYCESVLSFRNILKILRGKQIGDRNGKRNLNRSMVLRIAYLHSFITQITEGAPEYFLFDTFRETADRMLSECLFLPYQPSFIPDAVFTQATQLADQFFSPLIYQIFLPKKPNRRE